MPSESKSEGAWQDSPATCSHLQVLPRRSLAGPGACRIRHLPPKTGSRWARPISRQTRKVWVGRANQWPNPSLLRGQMEGPGLRPHSRSHRVDTKGGWTLRRCWRRGLTTLIPPEDRGHCWERVWNWAPPSTHRGTRSERGGQGHRASWNLNLAGLA